MYESQAFRGPLQRGNHTRMLRWNKIDSLSITSQPPRIISSVLFQRDRPITLGTVAREISEPLWENHKPTFYSLTALCSHFVVMWGFCIQRRGMGGGGGGTKQLQSNPVFWSPLWWLICPTWTPVWAVCAEKETVCLCVGLHKRDKEQYESFIAQKHFPSKA